MCSFHIWKMNFKKSRDSFYEYDDKTSGHVEGEWNLRMPYYALILSHYELCNVQLINLNNTWSLKLCMCENQFSSSLWLCNSKNDTISDNFVKEQLDL